MLSLFFMNISTSAQKIAVKSNLLYDASSSINIGTEFKLGTQTTFDLSAGYNPWTFSGNKKMKHVLVQPEVRFWTCESFFGHFWGIHAHYAYYNIGGLPIFRTLKDHRYEGWLAGAGFSYGYSWILGDRWSVEATLGVGYAYMSYEKHPCGKCQPLISDKSKHYFGPTKIGLAFIFLIN